MYREKDMEKFEGAVKVIDRTLSTKRRRHIIGGVIVSVGLLFCGLAFTVITLKMED